MRTPEEIRRELRDLDAKRACLNAELQTLETDENMGKLLGDVAVRLREGQAHVTKRKQSALGPRGIELELEIVVNTPNFSDLLKLAIVGF